MEPRRSIVRGEVVGKLDRIGRMEEGGRERQRRMSRVERDSACDRMERVEVPTAGRPPRIAVAKWGEWARR